MMMNNILDYLDSLYPNPRSELNYNKDYEILIAIVLSAQTTDKRVNMVTPILFSKYPSLKLLSEAKTMDIATIIKPIGTYHKKASFVKEIALKLVNDKLDKVPNDRKYLEALPGVGRKTANVFLANIYDEATIAVDTHVARVSKRLKLVKEDDDVLAIEKKLMKKVPKDRWSKFHHQMVLFGRYKCKAIKPECEDCKLRDMCKYNKHKVMN